MLFNNFKCKIFNILNVKEINYLEKLKKNCIIMIFK